MFVYPGIQHGAIFLVWLPFSYTWKQTFQFLHVIQRMNKAFWETQKALGCKTEFRLPLAVPGWYSGFFSKKRTKSCGGVTTTFLPPSSVLFSPCALLISPPSFSFPGIAYFLVEVDNLYFNFSKEWDYVKLLYGCWRSHLQCGFGLVFPSFYFHPFVLDKFPINRMYLHFI